MFSFRLCSAKAVGPTFERVFIDGKPAKSEPNQISQSRRRLERTVDRVIVIAAASFKIVVKQPRVMGLKIHLCCFWQPLQLNSFASYRSTCLTEQERWLARHVARAQVGRREFCNCLAGTITALPGSLGEEQAGWRG